MANVLVAPSAITQATPHSIASNAAAASLSSVGVAPSAVKRSAVTHQSTATVPSDALPLTIAKL